MSDLFLPFLSSPINLHKTIMEAGVVEICQRYLPLRPWEEDRTQRLPGLNPMLPGEWLLQDEAYGTQMAHRLHLMATCKEAVHQISDAAMPAAQELLECVLEEVRDAQGYHVSTTSVICPDGRKVEIDYDQPLLTCGAIVQEDLVIMEKIGSEHVLTGAILCFPSSWTLAEKFMQPMTRIHVPVEVYTEEIAKRVQRLFDGIQVARPMWRGNYLSYGDPELHQPRLEKDVRLAPGSGPQWLRVERQGMRRLERSGAVIFSIHTYVLSEARLAELEINLPAPSGR